MIREGYVRVMRGLCEWERKEGREVMNVTEGGKGREGK